MTTLYGILAGLGSAILASLIALVSSRASTLRMLGEEAEVIATMPEGSKRRAAMEEASDLYADRYLSHAKEPHMRRDRWLSFASSLALFALALLGAHQAHSTAAKAAYLAITAFAGLANIWSIRGLARST